MKIKLDNRKSLNEIAAEYYERAKKIKAKMERLEKKIKEMENKTSEKREENRQMKRKKKWYEEYRWSWTCNKKKLILIGKNAKQNDRLYSTRLEDKDIAFHSDIKGGSLVILKNGIDADEEEIKEAAQLTVVFSNAWAKGFSNYDCYWVEKNQISKHSNAGYIGKGGFAIFGKRNWVKGLRLAFKIGLDEEGYVAISSERCDYLKKAITLVPGKESKERTVKRLSKKLNAKEEEIRGLLPSGNFAMKM